MLGAAGPLCRLPCRHAPTELLPYSTAAVTNRRCAHGPYRHVNQLPDHRTAVVAKAHKNLELNAFTLSDAVARPNPERRLVDDYDFRGMLEGVKDWAALYVLSQELQPRMDRQYNLAVAVVLKAAEVLDVEAATPTQRRQAKEVLDAMTGYILGSAAKLKQGVVPSLLGAAAALQYRNPQLMKLLLGMLQAYSGRLQVDEMLSAACSAAQLGSELPPACLRVLCDKMGRAMKYLDADGIGNAASALCLYPKLPLLRKEEVGVRPKAPPAAASSKRSKKAQEAAAAAADGQEAEVEMETVYEDVDDSERWLAGLAAAAQLHLQALPGPQLVDLLLLFAKHKHALSAEWMAGWMECTTAALPGLGRPSSYASLLFALARGQYEISEAFLVAVMDRTLQPPSARLGGDSVLYSMGAKDLVVVASVLSIYGFVPPGSWPEQYVEALQAKAGDMNARQATIVLDVCGELGLDLGQDGMDELLAVAQPGLAALPALQLRQLAVALGSLQHEPDGPWLREYRKVLTECVARCAKCSELVTVLEAMVALPVAFPVTSPHTAQLLAAVQAHAVAATGVDEQSRERMREILVGIGYGKAEQYLAKMVSGGAASTRDAKEAKGAARPGAAAAAPAGARSEGRAAEVEPKKAGRGRKAAGAAATEEAAVPSAAAVAAAGSHAGATATATMPAGGVPQVPAAQGGAGAGAGKESAAAAAGPTGGAAAARTATRKKAVPAPSLSASRDRQDTYDELLDIVSSPAERQQVGAEAGARMASAPHMATAATPAPSQNAAAPAAASDDEGNVSYDEDGELLVSSTRTRRRR